MSLFFGTKCDATSTAIGKNHPPFPLRSKIIPFILCSLSVWICVLRRFSVSSQMMDILIYHSSLLSLPVMILLVTEGTDILSLVTSFWKSSLDPSLATLSIVSVTLLHLGPLI